MRKSGIPIREFLVLAIAFLGFRAVERMRAESVRKNVQMTPTPILPLGGSR